MKFYGQLLIFILLFITNLRVFFVHQVKRDPVVTLAPLSLLFSVLQIFAWGLDPYTLLALLLAILVLLSNFHALFRFISRLYVDHYSLLMKIWAVFTSLLSLAALALSFLFAPVDLTQNDTKNIKVEQIRLKGNFRSGFEKINSFQISDATVYKFSLRQGLESSENKNKVIVFFPDKRGDTQSYSPYLQLLAKKGFSVYSADFFCDDCRWLHSFEDAKILRRSAMVIRSLLNEKQFMAQREYYSYNISKECTQMMKFLEEDGIYDKDSDGNAIKKVYLVSDVMGNIALTDFYNQNKEKITDILFLDSIEDYKTPGYGCIQETDPVLAALFDIQKDKAFIDARILTMETEKRFSH